MSEDSTTNALVVVTPGEPTRGKLDIATVIIGRYWCPGCQIRGTVIRDSRTEIIACPHCGEVAFGSPGFDDAQDD